MANGWPTGTLPRPGHPLQAAIRGDASRTWPASRSTAIGVDGCGAPLFALSLTGLARAFAASLVAAPAIPERRVADAMRAHPDWTSGTAARNGR